MGFFSWFKSLFKHNDPDISEWKRWGTRNIYYYIGEDFGMEMTGMPQSEIVQTVISAFNEWSTISGLSLTLTIKKEEAHICVVEKDLLGSTAGFGFFPAEGSMNKGMQFDTSERFWNYSLLRRVALHEIGHCLGLMHIGNKRSIMYKRITKVDYIDSQSERLN